MKKLIGAFVVVVGILVISVGIMFAFQICPPEGPWPTPPWCEKQEGEGEIFVSVPFWTEGEVYIGTEDNPKMILMEKINEVSYFTNQGDLISKNGTYFYTRGSWDTCEIQVPRIYRGKSVKDAVLGWADLTGPSLSSDFQRGVVFGGMFWPDHNFPLINKNYEVLQEFGVQYIAVVPNWFVFPDYRGMDIRPFYRHDGEFPNDTNWITPTLTDEELTDIVKGAQEKGIKVVLKPHLDPIDFGMPGHEARGAFHPEDWDVWFEKYTDFILHYAKLSEELGIEILIIGTELDTATMEALDDYGAPPDATERWRKMIGQIRQVYSGFLTYSVACEEGGEGPSNIKFWDDLDFIGFEPYFGLTEKNNPSIEEMKEAFDRAFDQYAKPLYEKYGKPVLLTEVNVYSFDGVNRDPIGLAVREQYPGPDSIENLPVDHQEQADYYEAFFQSVTERDWIKGCYWWGWYLDTTIEKADSWLKEDPYDPFVRKRAGQVLKKWYVEREEDKI